MIETAIVIFLCVVFTIVASYILYRIALTKKAANGLCIRAEDGEVYLRLSEAAQVKLADPKTQVLILRVSNVSTRNKQIL